MKSNFRFIERNVDVSKILKQVKDNPQDWQAVSNYENIGGNLHPPGFLPLVMAVVSSPDEDPKNSEALQKTPMFDKYDEIIKWLIGRGFTRFSRAAFFRLFPAHGVGAHIDEGTYYLNKDRYHLSLQGTYRYEVDGEVHIIEPGTFFWFDNKKVHNAWNMGKDDRITFVFDVPHSPSNP
jgi:mannose-6-phosphate isomerase-like protein (cupin superfamily)